MQQQCDCWLKAERLLDSEYFSPGFFSQSLKLNIMASIINSLAVPSSYRDQLYQVNKSHANGNHLNINASHRVHPTNLLMIFQQQQHFTLVIYLFSQLKSKFMNSLENVEKLSVLLWVSIVTKRHLVDFVL